MICSRLTSAGLPSLWIDRAAIHSPWLLPADASAHGPALDHHLLLNLWVALALLTLAHLILLIGLFARRHSEPTRLWRIEYLPLTVLALLFASLTLKAERLWAASRYTGASPTALQVEVTGVQFAWYFRYPGPDATFGITRPSLVAPGEGNPLGLDPSDPHSADDQVTSQLVLPANREVDLRLRAQDVIHGFSIPEMRLKQNAVPGQTIHLHFTPTTPGTYAILCTQLCGLGHYRMNATLLILPPNQFATWLAAKQKAAP
ncbi:cupredoxin domain-containing protein [Tunturiibacter gelidoferens]|uniref:Cytochrome c oxidase subunit 2 n=1 Tax=Tunturiibacter gelidiferens TaxID=3069689 RepID=A0ACC5NW99_9BACT|nr:cytochrome c oxidase subunit 2 [Edaphobacter lichenicola]